MAGLAVHVVRTPERVVVVPKNRLAVAGTWADVRGWTAADAQGSEVARRLVELGKQRHLAHIDGLILRRDFNPQILDAGSRGLVPIAD